MRSMLVSNSRSLLQIRVFLFSRIQSSRYIENNLLIYLPTYRFVGFFWFFLNIETGFLERLFKFQACQCLRHIYRGV